MFVENVDERDVRAAEREAVYVVYLYEAMQHGRSTDVYILRDALFVEVMSWISDQVIDRDVLWALGVLAATENELIWIHGGDPNVDVDGLAQLERKRLVEMRRAGGRVLGYR